MSPAALSSWLTSQPVLAGLPRPTEALQQPGLAGCKGLILLELVSQQDTTPKRPGSLKLNLGTLRSEQKREKQ